MRFINYKCAVSTLALAFGLVVTSYSQTFLTNGLVAYYPFDGNASDASGNGNDGTAQHTASATDRFGRANGALAFNGINVSSNASLVVVSNALINLGQAGYTINLWFMPSNITQVTRTLFGNGNTTTGLEVGFNNENEPGTIDFFVGPGDAFWSSLNNHSPVMGFETGQWYSVSLTKSNLTYSLYINGQLQTQVDVPAAAGYDYLIQPVIGAYYPNGNQAFTGNIDDVRIYNRTLSLSEVQQLYQYETGLSNLPSITGQPQSQMVVVGQSASMSVSTLGAPPLSYQWRRWDGAGGWVELAVATNATLLFTNAQLADAGTYGVLVSNAYGSVLSSNAVLTVNPPPPCTPMPEGLIGWWRAEGDALDAAASHNGLVTNGVTFVPGEVGQAFSFNGTNGWVSLGNWCNPQVFSVGLWVKAAASQVSYANIIDNNSTDYRSWQIQYNNTGLSFHFGVATWGSVNFTLTADKWQYVAATVDSNHVVSVYLDGQLQGKLTGHAPVPYDGTQFLRLGNWGGDLLRRFKGQLDEVQLYNRPLTTNEVAAIYNASVSGTCPVAPFITSQPSSQALLPGSTASFSVSAGGTPALRYQWSKDAAPLPGQTNAILFLANVLSADAGAYAVLVSNEAGSVLSSNATLTVLQPLVITQQPQSQIVLSYNSAKFSVAATGTGPLSYRWRKNGASLLDGANVSGSATTNLTLASVSVSDAASYDVVVGNPYQAVTSAVAVLTVPQSVLALGSATAMSGSTVVVPVQMTAVGVENALAASVGYDPAKLALQAVRLGQGTAGAYLQEVDSQTNNGYVGFAILLDYGAVVPAGTQEVAQLVFQALPVTNTTSVSLTFGDVPTARQVLDNDLNSEPAVYQAGSVSILPAEYAADVFPRPAGDHQLTLQDWLEVGRMVAGLDIVTNADEFLRADCAPRNAPDGALTVVDWVQAGRYALGLDPLTLVSPPTPQRLNVRPLNFEPSGRTLLVASASAQRGQNINVPVQLVCITNENAVGLTVAYDPAQLYLLGVSLGTGFSGGRLNVNSNQAPGKLGLAVALAPGAALATGTNEVALLRFGAAPTAAGPLALTLVDTLVRLQVADKTATVLAANYVNGMVTLPPLPTIVAGGADGATLQLSWETGGGVFHVQTAESPLGPWTTISQPVVTNGTTLTVTVTTTNLQQFYRLEGQ
jgi:hypothetical protein